MPLTISAEGATNWALLDGIIENTQNGYIFTGNSSEYTFADNGDGTFTITDTVAGRDGLQIVNDNSDYYFADSTFRASGGVITGTGGADVITGGAGDETISGGDDADSISGGLGSDTISAGSGNDALLIGCGDEIISSGLGDGII